MISSTIQRQISRAAGSYAADNLREMGLLAMQCSILAGLRKRDGFFYMPDWRFVPRSPLELRQRWRLLRREFDRLSPILMDYIEEDEVSSLLCWEDVLMADAHSPLSLARIAFYLYPEHHGTGMAYLAGLIRSGLLGLALNTANHLLLEVKGGRNKSRLYRNLAGILDCLGDTDGSSVMLQNSKREWAADPLTDLAIRTLERQTA